MNGTLYKFVIIVLLLIAVGCGVKGDPVPPRSPVPAAVTDLSAGSRNAEVLLQWSIPNTDTEGKDLTNIGGFTVQRRIVGREEDECPTCPEKYDHLATIDYQTLQIRGKESDVVRFWDTTDKKPVRYRYRVITSTGQGISSGPSNVVTIAWASPPPPPQHLTAESEDRLIELSWQPPASPADAVEAPPAAGFNVYRRTESQYYPLVALNAIPLEKPVYQDLGVVNGETYFYVVRSLKQHGGFWIESENSNELEVVPRDFTAPPPPAIAIAFQTAEGIVIIWEPSGAPDLAGYAVYRRLVGKDQPERIAADVPPDQSRFVDTSFKPGMAYYYSVSALDTSPQKNESDVSQEVRVETKKP